MKRSFKFANSLVKEYGKQSIFYKYWIKIFLYTLIPFTILCLTVYAVVLHNTEEKLFATTTSEFEKSLLLLDDNFSSFNDCYLSLNTDEYLSLFFLSPSTETNFYSKFRINDNINHALNSRLSAAGTIKSIELYSYLNNTIFSSETGGHIIFKNDKPWINEFPRDYRKPVFVADDANDFRITFSYTQYTPTDGLISIAIKGNSLFDSINTFSTQTDFCLYDISTNTVIAGNDDIISSFDLTLERSASKVGGNYLYHSKTFFEDIIMLAKCHGNPNTSGTPFLLITIICVIISLILSVALSFYLSMQLYNSIAVITAEIQKNFGENGITGGTANELKYISLKLLELETKNKETEKELVNKISSLRLYQTIMLQNQFNPHFIFNTLNSITMILLNQKLTDERPVEMIALLSRLMRGAVNTEHYVITLENELKYSQTYIQLEKIKQKDNFDIKYEIDSTLLSQRTIKFILQPILENAFEHGIKKLPTSKRGEICLSICKQKENILISVRDNGPGMPKATLEKLLTQLREEDLLSSRHIGLCNTNNRIKIYYGESFGITNIISDENGTTVEILIPYEPSE